MASTTSSSPLPSGRAIFTKMPELLFIPELVAGGLVWALLVDSRKLLSGLYSEDWVMFVSIFCFVVTTILFICSASGINQKGAYWPTLDKTYHCLATVLYMSAAVPLALDTINVSPVPGFSDSIQRRYYKEHVAAVVMAFAAGLLYAVHTKCFASR